MGHHAILYSGVFAAVTEGLTSRRRRGRSPLIDDGVRSSRWIIELVSRRYSVLETAEVAAFCLGSVSAWQLLPFDATSRVPCSPPHVAKLHNQATSRLVENNTMEDMIWSQWLCSCVRVLFFDDWDLGYWTTIMLISSRSKLLNVDSSGSIELNIFWTDPCLPSYSY